MRSPSTSGLNTVYVKGPADIIAKAKKILDKIDEGPEFCPGTPFLKCYATPPGQAEILVKQLSEIPTFKTTPNFKIWASTTSEITLWGFPSENVEFAKVLADFIAINYACPKDDQMRHALVTANIEFATAKSKWEDSQVRVDWYKKFFDAGAVDKKMLDETIAEHKVAAAELKAAEAALELERAKLSLVQVRKQAAKDSEPEVLKVDPKVAEPRTMHERVDADKARTQAMNRASGR